MPNLTQAIALAVAAHGDQQDRAGQPYILHPLRVMFRLQTDDERIAGVLHDVVEDTPYTLDALRDLGYAEVVVQALDCLTRRSDEGYEQFVERILPNRLACRVKLADLEDNMDLRRLDRLDERDLARLQRYRAAWARLTDRVQAAP